MSPNSHRPHPKGERTSAAHCWRYFTAQRIIVVAFALIEAAALGWAVVHTMLRDVAR